MKLLLQICVVTFLFGVSYALSVAEWAELRAKCQVKCRHDDWFSCYLPHPRNCQKYFRCVRDLSTFNYFYLSAHDCAFGTFFSHVKDRCDHSYNVNCPNDPCKKSTTPLTFAHKVDVGLSNCRAHWVCRDKRSYAACCPSGSRYTELEGCVKDESCRSHCDMETKCVKREPGRTCRSFFNCTEYETFQPSCCPLGQEFNAERQECVPNHNCILDCDMSCPYKAVGGNKKVFLHAGNIKSTPAGTVFNEKLCAFVNDVYYRPNSECKPKVDLNFNEDISIPRLGVSFFGVKDKMGVGYFKNDSYIEIPYFDHGSGLDKVLIHLRFKAKERPHYSSKFQVILSNCRTDENSTEVTPSLQIVLSKINNMLIFIGSTTKGYTGSFQLPYEPGQWNELWVVFNGETLKAKIRQNSATPGSIGEITLKGSLKPSVSSLSIAGCVGVTDRDGNDINTFFHGEMDDIQVYTGCLPKTHVW